MEVKQEYPRPQLVREKWQSLNGFWDFAFDDADQGILQKWYKREIGRASCRERVSSPV